MDEVKRLGIPHTGQSGSVYHDELRDFCRRLVVNHLARHRGNRTETAKALGIRRTYLCALIKRHGIIFPARLEPHP